MWGWGRERGEGAGSAGIAPRGWVKAVRSEAGGTARPGPASAPAQRPEGRAVRGEGGAGPRAGPGQACGGQRGPAGSARRGCWPRQMAAVRGLAHGAAPALRAPASPGGRPAVRGGPAVLPFPWGVPEGARLEANCWRDLEVVLETRSVCVCVSLFFFSPLPVFLLIRGRSWSWGRCFLSWNTSPESARSGEYPSRLRISLGHKTPVCVRTGLLAFSVLELQTESPRKTVLACFYTLLVICCSFLGKPIKICVCMSKHTMGTSFCFSCG